MGSYNYYYVVFKVVVRGHQGRYVDIGMNGLVSYLFISQRRSITNRISLYLKRWRCISIAMPIETEIKISVDCHDDILVRLNELNAVHIKTALETNTFYDHPVINLIDQGCGLRLRHELFDNDQEYSTITYKGPKIPGQVKIRPEYETEMADIGQMIEILNNLGFTQELSFQKKRQTYKLGDALILLDIVPLLGCFIEIEAESIEIIQGVQSQLNLLECELVSQGYPTLLAQYIEQNNMDSRVITF